MSLLSEYEEACRVRDAWCAEYTKVRNKLMRLTKGKGSGSTNCGEKDMTGYAKRPGVSQDRLDEVPRGAVQPPRTKNTSPTRVSKNIAPKR